MWESLISLLKSSITGQQDILMYLAKAIGLSLLALGIYIIIRQYVLKAITHLIAKTNFTWDDLLITHKVFHRALTVIPILIIYYYANQFADAEKWIQKICLSITVFIAMRTADALFKTITSLYQQLHSSVRRPIKGYVQIITILMYSGGSLLTVAILLEKDLTAIFAGLGALTAVLILVFRDSILGLVASIQITSNNLVSIGDWVEVEKYGADGDVLDIGLHTIKVQNWDKTITTIPTYALISESFKNWQGMTESGGRRIKRNLYLDVNSIHFCSPELIEKLSRIHFLKEYLEERSSDIQKYNALNNIDPNISVNGRNHTNSGIFRKYIEAYLDNHPKIHSHMTFLVRQLEPGPQGLPLQMYVFCNDQAWVSYEEIQSDIFDHLLAAVPEFELRLFQQPTGSDFQNVKHLSQNN